MRKKKWDVERPRSWRSVSCCFYLFLWNSEDILLQGSPAFRLKKPPYCFRIILGYSKRRNAYCHLSAGCRLSIKYFKILSRVESIMQMIQCPVSALTKLTVHRCQPWSWWAMHSDVGPLTGHPILYCFFATLKRKKKGLPLYFHNSADVWVQHCLAPNQIYFVFLWGTWPFHECCQQKVTCHKCLVWELENLE